MNNNYDPCGIIAALQINERESYLINTDEKLTNHHIITTICIFIIISLYLCLIFLH